MVVMCQGVVLEEVAVAQGEVAMTEVLHRVVGVGEGVGQVTACMGCYHPVWTGGGGMWSVCDHHSYWFNLPLMCLGSPEGP